MEMTSCYDLNKSNNAKKQLSEMNPKDIAERKSLLDQAILEVASEGRSTLFHKMKKLYREMIYVWSILGTGNEINRCYKKCKKLKSEQMALPGNNRNCAEAIAIEYLLSSCKHLSESEVVPSKVERVCSKQVEALECHLSFINSVEAMTLDAYNIQQFDKQRLLTEDKQYKMYYDIYITYYK